MTTAACGPDDLAAASAAVLATTMAVARDLHAGRTTAAAVALDSDLDREVGLDSLSRVELGARLERQFDVRLDERAVFEAATPRDLLRLVIKAHAGRALTVRTVDVDDAAPLAHGLPTAAITLADMLDWHVAHNPNRPHIQFYDDYTDGAVLSYADLHAAASALGAALQAHGLEPGERVALMLPTSRAYFVAFFGTLLAGGVPVPIYPPVRRQQLEDHLRRQSRILLNCQAAMLVTTDDALAMARLLTAQVETLRHVFAATALERTGGVFEAVARGADDLAFLQYTSGSTGDPKGVMLSHANLLANIRADGAGMGAGPDDVFVSWLPLYHDMGLIGAWLGSLYHGVRLVVMPPLSFLARPERWLWAIHRYGGTLSAAPNFAYELCVQRIRDADVEGLDLARWRIAANGAEAISARTLDAFCTRFARHGFRREAMFPVYGLAECSVGLAFTPLGRGPKVDVIARERLAHDGRAVPAPPGTPESATIAVVACGLPLPGHQLRVVDAADRELPERVEGRLQFRGPSATSGYFGRAEETARLCRDGWLETGDRAYLAAGELYLTGRSKDVIIRAGRNIYPTELEDAVGELDGIRRGHVAVFGVVDADNATERVVVMAETRKRDAAARERLRTAINALATDLIAAPPDDVALVVPNTVLRTSSGKIRRSACKSLYEGGHLDGARERALWLQVARLALAGVGPQWRRLRRAAVDRLWAGWAWTVFACGGLAAAVVAWLPLPRRLTWRVVRGIARASALGAGLPLELDGAHHVPSRRAAVLVANHQSYLDGLLLTALLPHPVRFLVKADLAGSTLIGRPLTNLGALFVERFEARAGVAALAPARAALAAGDTVAVFPEGTFKRMPGVLPFHLGAFVLAAEAGVPVVPIAIQGTRSVLRAGSWFPRLGPVRVSVGAAVSTTAHGWDGALALRDGARAHILAVAGEPDLAHESNDVEAG
ncbi:MAG: AMP-binding protein [Gammaproteobacteria bacterium]